MRLGVFSYQNMSDYIGTDDSFNVLSVSLLIGEICDKLWKLTQLKMANLVKTVAVCEKLI